MRKQLSALAILAALTGTLLNPVGAGASTVTTKTLDIEGTQVKTSILVQNNRQLVPVTFFRYLDADVSWSARYNSAVVRNPSVVMGFPIGTDYVDYELNRNSRWKRAELSTTAVTRAGKVYVPLAYTARMLGMNVRYNANTKQTSISPAWKKGTVTVTAKSAATKAAATQPDIKWLYRITEAEAGGESYKGKVAVAATILNRVKSPEWPDTIKDTIFQVTKYNGKSYYQYSPVLDKRIYSVKPSAETIRAVDEAMRGTDPSYGALVFYNSEKTDNQWVRDRKQTVIIGNHVFAK
ncbi:peptidoglycan-binding protein [Paenibacillus darwinianus]|uniref:Peptidoglycan-binding protein n=1 Tax=Paenibacillus darwinianus TaxID=1380763 RepID=A0A9W5S243_9BACL|nr:cell wall hydrolase [Paenibacillus darwinianus]EXX86017.1 peptidoglycan-binding protein [Paenibacillus darwinianus]EXX88788.1 peptidoglycan-binding protein [Paenibacillus darwinianus]EXX89757.1 peptidoglycan-binding protein [Paenibacillus darwinianus]